MHGPRRRLRRRRAAATRSARLALGVLLDFLLAAGLLRLIQRVTAGTLLAAAAVVAVRRLLVIGPAAHDTRRAER